MLLPIEIELRFVVEPQISPCCGPLFFARSLESAAVNIAANGSFGLVDTGRKKLLVTCHHVWEEFDNLRRDQPELRLLVCLDRNPPVLLDHCRLINADKNLDLATFDISHLLGACGGRTFYPLNTKPPPLLRAGDRLAFVGYPGVFRFAADDGVQFGRTVYGVHVSDVSGLKIMADISQAIAKYVHAPSDRTNLHGGISGTPCFLVRRDWPVQLVAFATAEALGCLRFTHACCLNADGTIAVDH